jgi:hypothetical protein
MESEEKQQSRKNREAKEQGETPRIKWDYSGIKTTYANVCNVSSTREEVSVLFGTNQTMNVAQGEILIELTDRIILNPYAAKRLALVLDGVIRQYEATFGELPVETK